MLTTGMVPALFADDEKEAIVGNCRAEAQSNGVPPVKEMIWQYFVSKCSNNLHIVLAMSPVGDTLRTRCRNFPGLVNNTSIDWFQPWPKQALHAVATVFLNQNNNLIVEDMFPKVVEHVVTTHLSLTDYSARFLARLRRPNYVTPKNYLDYISSYTRLLIDKDKLVVGQVSAFYHGTHYKFTFVVQFAWRRGGGGVIQAFYIMASICYNGNIKKVSSKCLTLLMTWKPLHYLFYKKKRFGSLNI